MMATPCDDTTGAPVSITLAGEYVHIYGHSLVQLGIPPGIALEMAEDWCRERLESWGLYPEDYWRVIAAAFDRRFT